MMIARPIGIVGKCFWVLMKIAASIRVQNINIWHQRQPTNGTQPTNKQTNKLLA